MLAEYHEKISRRLWRCKKAFINSTRRPYKNTLPVFIMGCGRSGTTMMINIFHRDQRAEALDENSPKIAKDYMLLLDRIPAAIKASKAPVLVMKPILNSFDTSHLLTTYTTSRVIWMIRDYKDMVASSIKKFDKVVSDYLKNFILFGTGDNWLSRGLPQNTREMLSAMDSSGFTLNDWMALVWWSVNRTIILNRLHESDRFLPLRYETLVRQPAPILKMAYSFIGLHYHDKAAKYVHRVSVGKGATVQLHPDVEKRCSDLDDTILRLSAP